VPAGWDGKSQVYRIFGAGADPKAGAFLVLRIYSNSDEQLDRCIPRRTLSGPWFQRKE
jgi:hypothetical protein